MFITPLMNIEPRLVCFDILKIFLKNLKFFIFYFYFKLIFFCVFRYFNVLISKIILKNYYFNISLNKNYFKK